MAGMTPEIRTRFTLDGMQQSVGKLRLFGRAVLQQFDTVRRKTAETFEPFAAGVKAAEDRVKRLGKETARVGAQTAFKGIRLGALASLASVTALGLKMAAVGAAAIKSSKDAAESLNEIAIQAKRISATPEEISVLRFAAERNGTDLDEIVTQIATISSEFLTVRETIGKADEAYQQFLGNTARRVAIMSRQGDRQGVVDAITGFDEAALEQRKNSLMAIEQRLAEIDGLTNRIFASSDQRSGLQGYIANEKLNRERAELIAARDQLQNGVGPQGQALFTLQDYGLDVERASRGGVDSLYAISEAFQRISDPSERARVAMRLFGEDAGVKLVPLLAGGKTAIDGYRRELERLGGVTTSDDIVVGDAFKKSSQNLQTAIGGVKLEIGRQLMPLLTDTNNQVTEWLVRSRGAIASYVKTAFVSLRTFVQDILSILRGDTSQIQTKWLDTLVKKSALLREVWLDVKLQIIKLISGQDSDYKWLNTIRDHLLVIKAFALDTWVVISGGSAKEFPLLNTLRDQVVAFGRKLSDAWDLFKGFLSEIRDFAKPVLDFFGIDPTTFALFLGIARLTGVLGGVMTAVKLLGGAFTGLFSLGSGALAAGAGVASAGAALGGAAATAGGFTASLIGIQTALGGIARAAGVMGAALVGGFALGQKAGEAFYNATGNQAAYDKLIDAQTALIRARDNNYLNMRLNRREERDYGTMRAIYGRDGQDYSWLKTSAESTVATLQKMDQLIWGKPHYVGADAEAQYRAERPWAFRKERQEVAKHVQVDLNVGGLQFPVFTDDSTADGLTRTLESFNRR